jgi:uncharacterized membrane protein
LEYPTTPIRHPPALAELQRQRRPVRDVNRQHAQQLGRLDRLALAVTRRVGTMGFFLLVFTWTLLWLGWNLLAPARLQFDPPTAFVFWLFISNMIQLFLMPLLMVGQNLQGKHSELRAESDFEVNVKAEREVDALLQHLEQQRALLLQIADRVGVKADTIAQAPDRPA